MGRLIIVSNRLPVTLRVEGDEISVAPSAGGLATALRGPHAQGDSLWIGWPGDVSGMTDEQRASVETHLAELRTAPVYLDQSEVTRYYEGFSNGVLWPLFHYQLDKVRVDAHADWGVYESVNERFADAVAEHYQPGDAIWVHDYQLMLLPEALRRRIPNARIGFFLHIPFPAPEVFRTLPWREKLLRGLLGADVIGFHTASYRYHFVHAAAWLVGVEPEIDVVSYDGRQVRLGVYPISVDTQELDRLASTPEVRAEAQRIREQAPGGRVVLGVDRLDYTKGLPRRLAAIESFLESEPELRNQVRFVQLAVPTRENVEAYEQIRKEVHETVGRINGRYGSVDAVPIHFLYRSVPIDELVALYAAADVMLVTPLRDGMNLVAKEYVATRTDDTGVLVLSELTGAASELVEALPVNPYDVEGVAAAIKQALTMPETEQRLRMHALRRRVTEHDVHRWARSFIADLEQETATPEARSAIRPGAPPLDVAQRAREAPRLVMILDYDGTLVPIAALPELAEPDAEVLDLLRDLAARPSTRVHLASGRRQEDLERWFGALPIDLHAEHGFTSRDPEGIWTTVPLPAPDWLPEVRAIFDGITARTPGSFVEDKQQSLAWHYRVADFELARERLREIATPLSEPIRAHDLEILRGSKVIEVRPRGLNKGLVVARALSRTPEGTAVVAIGDDRTDEDLFAALPPSALAIHVGGGVSRAVYRLPDPVAVRRWLRSFLR
ncbi:Alpha,alpha-trehalose-phosphate synthase [Minicystis rosea]|nr:Alpha,alpha-trehalose-phosphate synthase [Minicystis rosea]